MIVGHALNQKYLHSKEKLRLIGTKSYSVSPPGSRTTITLSSNQAQRLSRVQILLN